MKRAFSLFAALVATTSVAAWEIDSSDTKKSWSYAAFQSDKAGGVELQFYCDDSFPDDIQMLVFTNLDATPDDQDYPSVAVDMLIDGQSFADLSGYYDDVDGERTIVVDTTEEDRVRDILDVARAARQPLQVRYENRSHRFAVDSIDDTLGAFIDGCHRR